MRWMACFGFVGFAVPMSSNVHARVQTVIRVSSTGQCQDGLNVTVTTHRRRSAHRLFNCLAAASPISAGQCKEPPVPQAFKPPTAGNASTSRASAWPRGTYVFPFHVLQHRMQALRRPIQLLSPSIDPLGDTPSALSTRLQIRGTVPGRTCRPGVPRVRTSKRSRQRPAPRLPHRVELTPTTAPASIFFDVWSKLRWRSADVAGTADVLRMMEQLAA